MKAYLVSETVSPRSDFLSSELIEPLWNLSWDITGANLAHLLCIPTQGNRHAGNMMRMTPLVARS